MQSVGKPKQTELKRVGSFLSIIINCSHPPDMESGAL